MLDIIMLGTERLGVEVSKETFDITIQLNPKVGLTAQVILSPDQARELSETLRKKAEEAEYGRAAIVPPAVHALQFGFPVCGFARTMPSGWPPGHTWDDADKVTCERCLREVARREAMKL